MTNAELHAEADRMVRQLGISHSEALSRLGRAGNRAKRRQWGVLHPLRVDRAAFANVEPPANAWWTRDFRED